MEKCVEKVESIEQPLRKNEQCITTTSIADGIETSRLDEDTRMPPGRPPYVPILGVPVSAINMDMAVRTLLQWASDRREEIICVRDCFGLMCAVRDPEMMKIQLASAMITPDGMPLVLISKLRSNHQIGRVSGADLMDALCNAGQATGLRHYFYGGKTGVPEAMIENLKSKYPDLREVGSHSPAFRPLTEAEDAAVVAAINESGAQIVWVGISTPNQEFWMRDHVGRVKGAILIGVGAAFDFQSGAVPRAPLWMQSSCLEWLHRLLSEPRRLWRRYLVIAPQFVAKVVCEQVSLMFRNKRIT